MSEYILRLIGKHGSQGIVVDSNILMLLIVGSLGPQWIGRHRRTQNFRAADFELLVRFLSRFKKVVTTPNVLTEVSNLVGKVIEIVDRLKISIESMEEKYVTTREAVTWSRFRHFGIADSATALLAKEGLLILTDDIELAQTLEHDGLAVLNFDHLRDWARTK